MSKALLYLWFELSKRRLQHFCLELRRPTRLMGIGAVFALLYFLFHYRHHEIFAQLVRTESLVGAALVMVCGSVFKGFLQRGLIFERPDLEFLFTSPFSQRQLVFYRLLPNYLFTIVQSVVFLALFGSHLRSPVLTTLCFTLLQAACFHLATAAALFAGTLSEIVHQRLRWMMLAAFFLLASLYLRVAWDFKLIPAFAVSPWFQLVFYPAVTVPDAASALPAHLLALRLFSTHWEQGHLAWQNVLYLGGFSLAALSSLALCLKLKSNLFEHSFSATNSVAEEKSRLRKGKASVVPSLIGWDSVKLPKFSMFRGVGAIVWKNLVVARRSRREMFIGLGFTLVYTGFLTALLWIFHSLSQKAGGAPESEAREFTTGIAMFVATLAFFLQRMFPFDFRRDGFHLVDFRTLPVSPFKLALAEIAVPTAFCLASQVFGIIPLVILGHFDLPTLTFVLLGYPAVALALNGIWNVHYLLSATKPGTGEGTSGTAVGTLMVVALSFLIFFPAGWVTVKVANQFITENSKFAFAVAGACGLGIQYTVDALLILVIAALFQHFEVSRDFQ